MGGEVGSEAGGQVLDVGGGEVDVVADEEGGGWEAGHYLEVYASVIEIEEQVVAEAWGWMYFLQEGNGLLYHVSHGVNGTGFWQDDFMSRLVLLVAFDKIGTGRVGCFCGNDIYFCKGYMGPGGHVYFNAITAEGSNTCKFCRVKHQLRLKLWEADYLHVRMRDSATGKWPQIFKEDSYFIFATINHVNPVAESKVHQLVKMLRCIIRNIAVAYVIFNEYQLVRIFNDLIFIFQQNDAAISVYNINQLIHSTKWTGRIGRLIAFDGTGLLFANGNIKG